MKNKLSNQTVAISFACALVIAVAHFFSGCAKSRGPSNVTPLPGIGFAATKSARSPNAAPTARQLLAALPASDDELWIIARSSDAQTQASDDLPGSGSLMTLVAQKQVPMPLKHTDVRASVSGYIGSVEVVQQFHNPYDTKIEAVYVFPLPHNAAVNEFIMTIGERRIRGIIRERKEAEEIYAAAKQQGYVASLLTEERPNIFTQSVANIEPGKAIDVTIKYFHTLDYVDGGMNSFSPWSSPAFQSSGQHGWRGRGGCRTARQIGTED